MGARIMRPALVPAFLIGCCLSATPPPKTHVQGRQLMVTASATQGDAGPMQRVALTLDIDLQPNMHVYAPGVEGYIPIEWQIAASALVTPHQVNMPKPEVLYLKAIDEKVPVFKDHLQLTREITFGSEDVIKKALDASGNFTIPGTLKYQACDDRLCYIPQTLQLKWTFHYEAAGRQK